MPKRNPGPKKLTWYMRMLKVIAKIQRRYPNSYTILDSRNFKILSREETPEKARANLGKLERAVVCVMPPRKKSSFVFQSL